MTNPIFTPEPIMFRNNAFANQTSNTPQPATETATMQNPRRNTFPSNRLRNLAASVAALGVAAVLSGCAGSLPSNFGVAAPAPAGAGHLTGKVFGGQQPVSGSTIQLYTVGTTGLKSASSPLIGTTVTSDANGNFTITGDYTCTGTTPGTQVYITATGGNSGSGTNNNLTMAAALGSCATLLANAATTFITVNEVTTVAAAYALAPFASSMTSIGGTGSNPSGLVNAFANAALLANTSSGASGGSGLATGVTVPTTEINTLADILAACVNTTGSGSTQCNTLFSATGATDTFGAVLGIAKNPGAAAVTALTSLVTATPPFVPAMTTAPNDFTVAVNFAGAASNLSTPYSVAIDASGNAWVANEGGSTVAELSPTGSVVATPTATGLYGPQGIAIDTVGNVWVANTAGNSVIKFTLTSGIVTGNNSFTAGGISAPSAIALDTSNNAYIANFNGNSVTKLNSAGTSLGNFTGSSNDIVNPTGIALDSASNILVTSGNGYVVKLTGAGAFSSTITDNTLQGPVSIGVAPTGSSVGVTGFTTGSTVGGALTEFTDAGGSVTVSGTSPVTSGLTTPAGVASDGTSFWVANSAASGSLAQFAFGSSTPASPTAGFGSLNVPVGVAVDASGSIWTANSGSNSVSKFIGLAVPVNTPVVINLGS